MIIIHPTYIIQQHISSNTMSHLPPTKLRLIFAYNMPPPIIPDNIQHLALHTTDICNNLLTNIILPLSLTHLSVYNYRHHITVPSHITHFKAEKHTKSICLTSDIELLDISADTEIMNNNTKYHIHTLRLDRTLIDNTNVCPSVFKSHHMYYLLRWIFINLHILSDYTHHLRMRSAINKYNLHIKQQPFYDLL